MTSLNQRKNAFIGLGLFLASYRTGQRNEKWQKFYADLDKLIPLCFVYNGWFTEPNVKSALLGIEHMLDARDLEKFAAEIKEPQEIKTVALIMAGNIPAVGFHDLMTVLLSGHKALIKVSSDDHVLIPFLAGMLIYFEPELAPSILFAENKLSQFDAVIATGSNNTARHFEQYFAKYPHIIRHGRHSVAVLSGNESPETLKAIGKDVFMYFGLGCRNVSYLLVPKGYKFDPLYEAVFEYQGVLENKKYANNYEYNRAIYLLDGVKFLDNNFLMIREHSSLSSPVSVLHFAYYENKEEVSSWLAQHAQEIQCVVGEVAGIPALPAGSTQSPGIFDFADNVNTIHFLNQLN